MSLESFPQPSTPDSEPQKESNPEELSYTPMSPEEQKLHLEKMEAVAREFGFVESAELKTLRSDLDAWTTETREVLSATAAPSTKEWVTMNFGIRLAQASIYFEQRNTEAYFEAMDDLVYELEKGNFPELLARIQSLA